MGKLFCDALRAGELDAEFCQEQGHTLFGCLRRGKCSILGGEEEIINNQEEYVGI